MRSETAGGHVKCWERFAEAAALRARDVDEIDLTLYVLGKRECVEEFSPWVRVVALRPVLSSARITPLVGGVDVTDLSPFHPRLARLLRRHDVWHLTHTFAFASTAARLAGRTRRERRPGLVASVHTDVPALSAVYARQAARGLLGQSRWVDRFGAGPERVAETLARRRRDRLLRLSDRVLVAAPDGREEIDEVVGSGRVSLLRRGVDHRRFRPDQGARQALARLYDLPDDRLLVLFVGRVDASKRVLLVAEAVRRLVADGWLVHLVVVGAGADDERVAELLGPHVTRLPPLAQHRLARVYAGCDVFAFPSRTETVGNVVAEAMASGLPVVLPTGAATTQWLADPGRDGVVVRDDTPEGWGRALAELTGRPEARLAMARRATETSRESHPTWARVLEEDLVPVWRDVAWSRTRPGPG